MALRQVEVVLPAREAESLPAIVDGEVRGGPWTQNLEPCPYRL